MVEERQSKRRKLPDVRALEIRICKVPQVASLFARTLISRFRGRLLILVTRSLHHFDSSSVSHCIKVTTNQITMRTSVALAVAAAIVAQAKPQDTEDAPAAMTTYVTTMPPAYYDSDSDPSLTSNPIQTVVSSIGEDGYSIMSPSSPSAYPTGGYMAGNGTSGVAMPTGSMVGTGSGGAGNTVASSMYGGGSGSTATASAPQSSYTGAASVQKAAGGAAGLIGAGLAVLGML